MSDSPDNEVSFRVPGNELGQGDQSPSSVGPSSVGPSPMGPSPGGQDDTILRQSDTGSRNLLGNGRGDDTLQGAQFGSSNFQSSLTETPTGLPDRPTPFPYNIQNGTRVDARSGPQPWTSQGHEVHRPNVMARYSNAAGNDNQPFSNGSEPRARRGLPVSPESFDGKGDWEEYVSHFENCAELGRWNNAEKVLALAASLRGAARTFYIGLSAIDKRSYSQLVQHLGERFGSTRQQSRWLSKLEMRRRQADESIAALGDDLRQMSQKAYCNLDTNAQEALALNQLYKAITLEMKCRCIDRDCRTVADAVDVIERYEALVDETKEKRKPVTRMVSQGEESMQNILARIEYLECSRAGVNATYTNQSGYAATNHNQAGNNPRHANQYGYNSANSRPGYNARGNGRLCFICDSPEHFFRNCPFYQKCKSFTDREQPRQQSGNDAPSA
jgi:hypothetical protein